MDEISFLTSQFHSFCRPLLVTFGLPEFGDLYTHVVLKLSVHSRSVAKPEKYF